MMRTWPFTLSLTIVALTVGSSQAQQPSGPPPAMQVGAAKVDVTPKFPVVLAGYGSRNTEYEGVDTKLWARALVLGKDEPLALVVLDNCGVPKSIVARLAERLEKRGVKRDRLVVAATHTHNAPTLQDYATILWAGRTTPAQDKHIAQYTSLVVEKMEAAVAAALENRRPLRLEWGQGRVNFGGNRRVLRGEKWSGFGFQRSGPVDHSLPVLAARDEKGIVRVVWTNYACHCTTVGSRNRIGGDWAGYANAWLEKTFPHAIALTTIGCGADIGPQPSGSLKIAEEHGRSIANEVKRVLAGRTTPLVSKPEPATRSIKLPLAEPQSRQYWERQAGARSFAGELAKSMLRRLDADGALPTAVDYPIAVWTFGDDLAIVWLAGEVVVDYSVRLKRELAWPRLWINAWANDMPGYIPSRRVLAEGGYEADFSQVYYDQPGRYDPRVEQVLITNVKELVGDRFAAKPNQPAAPYHQVPSGAPQAFRRLARWAANPRDEDEQQVLEKLRRLSRLATPAVGRLKQTDGEKTEWYDYAGDFVARVFIRQQQEGTELGWQTPAIAKKSDDSLVFCFTGGVGWQSQPSTAGFALHVNGRQKLAFDVVQKPSSWVASDKTVELLYLPSWTSNEDSGGFFFLSLPSSAVREDQTVTLSVRSLGKGSQRWFAIDAKQNIPQHLKQLQSALSPP